MQEILIGVAFFKLTDNCVLYCSVDEDWQLGVEVAMLKNIDLFCLRPDVRCRTWRILSNG